MAPAPFPLIKGNSPDTWVLTGSNTYTAVRRSRRHAAPRCEWHVAEFRVRESELGRHAGCRRQSDDQQFFGRSSGSGSFVTLASGKTLTVTPVTTGFTQTTYSGTISGAGSLAVGGTGTFFTNGSSSNSMRATPTARHDD